jgi:hypothetical protein
MRTIPDLKKLYIADGHSVLSCRTILHGHSGRTISCDIFITPRTISCVQC